MDGSSAQHVPLPPPAPVVVNTGPGAIADAAGTFVGRMAHFTPQQAQTASLMVLTLFVCVILGYQLYSHQQIQAETLGLVIRSMESEAEKNRAANTAEFERNRGAFAAEAKANRDAISDNAKMTIASHQKLSIELGKLEQVVSGLSATIADLRKKLPPQ